MQNISFLRTLVKREEGQNVTALARRCHIDTTPWWEGVFSKVLTLFQCQISHAWDGRSTQAEHHLRRNTLDTTRPRKTSQATLCVLRDTRFSLPIPGGCRTVLVSVSVDSFSVLSSEGENSTSLMGPRGTNGVSIVPGDCSMPRLRRYIWHKKK